MMEDMSYLCRYRKSINQIRFNMNTEIKKRIEALRGFMNKKGITAFVVPSTDPHAGEYVPEHWESRKWISGFTGSAGTAVITSQNGGLWTDSRYFIQAEEQLDGTGIRLFKERMPETPSIAEWLGETLANGDSVGIDGKTCGVEYFSQLSDDLKDFGINLIDTEDPFDEIWSDRPSLPTSAPFVLPLCYAGVPTSKKLEQIHAHMQQQCVDALIISSLDEVAWVLNMRGTDVPCNPVFVSYLFITEQHTYLYIDTNKLTAETSQYLQNNHIEARPYSQIEQDIKDYKGECIQLSPSANYRICHTAETYCKIKLHASPVSMMKATKNEVEIQGFHEAMTRDGVAMTKFLMWLKDAVKQGGQTECTIDKKLYELRAEQKLFQGISFETIAGYQEHGAIVHYEATPETASDLHPEGLLLLDSGAQYLDGTTDITRTIVLGNTTPEQKRDYTLVLKGFIALSMTEFPAGTCGTQLDIMARQFMWKEGINYGHGTGHGVGHFLNVHEGPHQIRMNHIPTPLQPGMTLTNEPGIYRSGRYGIRTENTMLVVFSKETEFGQFYKFEPLTLCPIDKEAICTEMLLPYEIEWLNDYHKHVYETLSPFLNEQERQWLKQATSEL